MKNIGILGSACDPPHNAHKEIGECARRALGLDLILLIPTGSPPHKHAPYASAKDRLAMARLFVKNLPQWEVSDAEIQRGGVSYTKDTLRALKDMYPHDALYVIIGLDNLIDMPRTWNGGYAMLDEYQFAATARPGYSLDAVPPDILTKVTMLACAYSDISSTMIRARIAKGEPIDIYLPSSVAKFIHKKRLYV